MMKNKLEKFHHKKRYYVMRRFLLIAGSITGLFLAIIIPTYIKSVSHNNVSTIKAEENSSETSETPDEITSEIQTYEDND